MPTRQQHRPRRRLSALAVGVVGLVALAGCSSGTDGGSSTSAAAPVSTAAATSAAATTPTTSAPATSAPATTASPSTSARATPRTTTPSAHATPSRTASRAAGRLPLGLSTGDAKQVITVVADGSSDTRARVQRWRASGNGWRTVGRAVDAYLGSAGIGKAREGSSKTPAGSFTLMQAFGRDGDPGTRLPYLRTTPDDYWISSAGSKYNTEQRCGDCGYDNGLNERLHAITPEYDHAVVIDYNTRNAPGGVKQGRGSAFFLHVAAGEPTAGCVAIARDDLVTVMTWLKPADDPRILIGVG